MAYAAVIAGLFMLIVIHELGHFLTARKLGIRVTKFYIGFPPAIFRKTHNDVEYGLGAIPLGGFVKIPGMFAPDPAQIAREITFWRHELERDGNVETAANLDPFIVRLKTVEGDEQLRLVLEDLDHHLQSVRHQGRPIQRIRREVYRSLEDVADDCYHRASLWKRMLVILAGPVANILVAFVTILVATMFFIPDERFEIFVDDVEAGTPATSVLQDGDRIVSWNGVAADSGEFYAELSRLEAGDNSEIVVDRNGTQRQYTLPVTEIDGRPRVGIQLSRPQNIERVGYQRHGLWTATRVAAETNWRIVTGSLNGLKRVITTSKGREEAGTIVGAVQAAPMIQEADRYWQYMAFISMILAVFNLLPIMPLDGGHLMFGFIEFLRRGKPVAQEVYTRSAVVGLSMIMLLFFIGLQNDLSRSFS